jgi:hypothetical protein
MGARNLVCRFSWIELIAETAWERDRPGPLGRRGVVPVEGLRVRHHHIPLFVAVQQRSRYQMVE